MLTSRLVGKLIFITGASSGIGEACAFEFGRAGANLILTARREERLITLKNKLQEQFPSIKVHTAKLDIKSKENVQSVISSLPDNFKAIDILVNNAGLVIGVDPVESVSEDIVNTIFDTNFKGLLFVTQAILPGMKERNSGCIVNINSVAGTQAYANGSIYCASKHAVTALTNSLRHELVATPINVISIEPGMVQTEFSVIRYHGDQEKADSLYKGMTPLTGQDIAELVVFSTSRKPHVQIASILVFPTNQSAATSVARKE